MSNLIRMFCISALLYGGAVRSAAQPQPPTEPLKIDIDVARFRGDDKSVYVEIYYAFPQWQLTYVQSAAGPKAAVELTTVAFARDSVAHAERVRVEHTLTDSVSRANLLHLGKMMLPEGEYKLKVIVKDVYNSTRADSLTQNLGIRLPSTTKLALSDIEFASNVKKGTPGSLFYKNTLDVIPNPQGTYGETQRCYFYLETYNLLASDDRSDYTVKTTVYNAIGREVIGREKQRKRSGESAVLVDQLEVASLRSGTYTLVISLLDSMRNPVTSSGKKFFVYNSVLGIDSSMIRLDPALSLNVYATMEEPDLDREFKWTRWEARDEEREQYQSLSGVAAKRKFLTDLWSKRPAGLRDIYMNRATTANRQFTVLGFEGYRTDRGRVHIIYGPPDDIDRHPNESGSRPYEIWSYNQIQGGVIFVFLLRQNGGDYELVHSTHRNELHDENWARLAQAD